MRSLPDGELSSVRRRSLQDPRRGLAAVADFRASICAKDGWLGILCYLYLTLLPRYLMSTNCLQTSHSSALSSSPGRRSSEGPGCLAACFRLVELRRRGEDKYDVWLLIATLPEPPLIRRFADAILGRRGGSKPSLQPEIRA